MNLFTRPSRPLVAPGTDDLDRVGDDVRARPSLEGSTTVPDAAPTDRGSDRSARPATSRILLLLVAADLVLCAGVRLWYLASDKVAFIGDEAVTGIMVRQILHGKMFIFYAGQHYGGTLEQYIQALGYLVFRLPQDAFTLRFTQVALSTLTCLLVYLCGVRLLSSPWRAALAALVFAISPWFNILGTSTSMGFYVVGQTLGIATIYMAMRVTEVQGGAQRRRLLGLGILMGLGTWNTLTYAYFLILAVIWVIPILGRSWKAWTAWLGGFVAGGAPLLGWMAVTHELPVPTGPAPASSVAQRLEHLTHPVLREFVGVAYRSGLGGLPQWMQRLVVGGLLVAYGAALWRRRRGILAIATFRAERHPVDLLLLAPLVVLAIYPVSSETWFTETPRYLLTLYPLFAIGLVGILPRRHVAFSATAAVVIVVLTASLCLGFFRSNRVPVTVAVRDRAMRAAIHTLVADGETRVYAGYWTAMPLEYLARDDVKVAVCYGPERFGTVQRSVESTRSPVYVVSSLDGTSALVAHALRVHHVAHRTTNLGIVQIYDQLGPEGQPWRIGLNPKSA